MCLIHWDWNWTPFYLEIQSVFHDFNIHRIFQECNLSVSWREIALYFVCNFKECYLSFWRITSLMAKPLVTCKSPVQRTHIGLRLGLVHSQWLIQYANSYTCDYFLGSLHVVMINHLHVDIHTTFYYKLFLFLVYITVWVLHWLIVFKLYVQGSYMVCKFNFRTVKETLQNICSKKGDGPYGVQKHQSVTQNFPEQIIPHWGLNEELELIRQRVSGGLAEVCSIVQYGWGLCGGWSQESSRNWKKALMAGAQRARQRIAWGEAGKSGRSQCLLGLVNQVKVDFSFNSKVSGKPSKGREWYNQIFILKNNCSTEKKLEGVRCMANGKEWYESLRERWLWPRLGWR